MKHQVTERPECSEVVEKAREKGFLAQKAKAGLKFLVSSAFMRPATWRWLIVHVPDAWEKAEAVSKQFIAWVADHF